MGKLSASILGADLAHLADQVKAVAAAADVIHIDVMDAHFVPPLTLGPVVVASLRPHTDRVLHGHLMVETPEGLFDELAEAGMEIVSFHVEAVDDPAPVIRKARDARLGVGLTVSPETPVEKAFPHLDDLDDLMVMSVHPGWAGQSFIPEALPKLDAARAEISRRGLEIDLDVDDDPDIARFVEVNLRSAGYDVSVASDGEQALEKAATLRPDLVLLDVMMPRIDGFEVAQRLRRNPQTANTSIIMLTAKALSADKVTGLTAGADDYIIKPFDPIELLARVKGTLRRAKEMRNLSPLTGLPGNIRLQEEIERQVREHHEFAVLYVDLDNFKTYNDQQGFVRGDRLIQATARIIQDSAVEGSGAEGFVGHVGG